MGLSRPVTTTCRGPSLFSSLASLAPRTAMDSATRAQLRQLREEKEQLEAELHSARRSEEQAQEQARHLENEASQLKLQLSAVETCPSENKNEDTTWNPEVAVTGSRFWGDFGEKNWLNGSFPYLALSRNGYTLIFCAYRFSGYLSGFIVFDGF